MAGIRKLSGTTLRNAATGYLNKLTQIGLLHKQKIGKENYYINTDLYNLLGSIKVNT